MQVSPHEFMQAVILASKKRFTLDHQSDPVEFASWLLNALHFDLTSGKIKKQSIITQCFQVRGGPCYTLISRVARSRSSPSSRSASRWLAAARACMFASMLT